MKISIIAFQKQSKMVIRRHLPKRYGAIHKALMMAKFKNDNINPSNPVLTPATQARLNAMEPLFSAAMQTCGNELAVQTRQTALVSEAFDIARDYISHFIQVFDFGVKRKKFPAAARAFYRLDVNSKKLPRLTQESDITHWGDIIESGDAARITAGGAAMSNPTAAEVKTAVDDFRTKNIAQSNMKDAFDKAQEAVMALAPKARKVIKKIWDEVETFYNEEKAPSRRRKGREWGIVYTSDVEIIFHFTVTDTGNAHIDNAAIELDETGNIVQTAHGAAQMKSQVSDFATFIIKHDSFQAQTIHLELPHGQTEYHLAVKLPPLT